MIGAVYAASPSTEYLPPVRGLNSAASVQRSSIASPSNEYLPPTSYAASTSHASFAPQASFASPSIFQARFAPQSAALKPQASYASSASFAPAQASFSAPSIQRSNFVAPSSEYLPTASLSSAASEPVPAHSLASDGYHYKTARRYRRKRDSPLNEYLPPLATEQHGTFVASASKQSNTVIAPPGVSAKADLEERVVSSNADSYAAAPSGISQAIVASGSSPPAHSLESDGYHYRTVKRYRLRRY